MLRFILILTVLMTSAMSLALPTAWSKYYDGARGGKLIRDASSNIYFVRPQPTTTGRSYIVEKFNAAGTRLWQETVWEAGPVGLQFEIQQLAINATHLFVLVQVRNEGGTGVAQQSWIRRHLLSTGGGSGALGAGNTAWTSMALNDADVVVHGYLENFGTAEVMFATLSLTDNVTYNLGSCEAAGFVRMDPSGIAYVSTTHYSQLKLTKCSRMGGIIYQQALDSVNHYGEDAVGMEIDYLANRGYVMMRGAYGPTDTDVMLYYVNLATGAQTGLFAVSNTANSEWQAALTLLPNQGVVASAVYSGLNLTRIVRRTTTGSVVWDKQIVVDFSNEEHVHAIGPDGNFHLASYESNVYSPIHRLNMATGETMNKMTTDLYAGKPKGLVLDAAGNMYASYDTVNGAMLVRLQPAQLSFSANNLTGGAAANGIITLSEPAVSDQNWTVASSNASLVGVPATVTVPQGSSVANFPLTIGSVTAITSVSVNVRHGGFVSQMSLTLLPSVVQSLSIAPQVVIGGVATTGTVVLTGAAPTGGTVVSLSSNKTNVATVPASATVPAGSTSTTFAVTTLGVNANQGVVITATTGSVSRTAFFAVNAPSLTSISIAPGTIKGGTTAVLTLNISGIAPTGGFSIVLVSGAPGIVIPPAAASVNAGQTTRNVSVPTAPVAASTSVLIFATRSGIYRTTTLTVTP